MLFFLKIHIPDNRNSIFYQYTHSFFRFVKSENKQSLILAFFEESIHIFNINLIIFQNLQYIRKTTRPVLDFYSKDTESWEFHLLDFWPDPGTYALRLECVGKNPSSAGCWIGVESVRLRERRPRVKEWAFEKDKDWRKAPVLYE